MVLRKLSLAEWFLRYQLLQQQKKHFYLPIELTLDVTSLYLAYGQRGEKFPATAFMIKAAAHLKNTYPRSHRAVFSTPLGPRMMEFDKAIVNVPMILKVGDLEVLTATVIRDADKKTLEQITEEVRQAYHQPLEKYPIANFVMKRRNNLVNRWILRALCYIAYNIPYFYGKKGGGGISVSSLYNNHAEGFEMRPYAFGPTALTFCFSSVVEENGRFKLKIGVGYDHTAISGNEMAQALKHLSEANSSLISSLRSEYPSLPIYEHAPSDDKQTSYELS